MVIIGGDLDGHVRKEVNGYEGMDMMGMNKAQETLRGEDIL